MLAEPKQKLSFTFMAYSWPTESAISMQAPLDIPIIRLFEKSDCLVFNREIPLPKLSKILLLLKDILLLFNELTQTPIQSCIELYEIVVVPDPSMRFRNCKPAYLSLCPPPIIYTP